MSKRPFKSRKLQLAFAVSTAPLALLGNPSIAQESVDAPASDGGIQDLLNLPIEELLTLESTSVAKKRQKVEDSAAAVAVITQDDIRRSAASTIPDLLRMVPGVEVGQQANGATAVAIRGFNSRASNSLLVMVDGRSVYVPLFSGVFWDQLVLPLGDIERIEVIRGPGASLWGANAVNGVINIITKHSSDSLGINAVSQVGTRKQEGSLSYGARATENLSYRAHGTYSTTKGLVDIAGKDQVPDPSNAMSAGIRFDWEPSLRDAFSLAGEVTGGRNNTALLLLNRNPFTPGYVLQNVSNHKSGFNVVARWARKQSQDLDWSLQFTFDKIARTELDDTKGSWQQADLDLGIHLKASAVHDLNFGVGARLMRDRIRSTPSIAFNNESGSDRWFSAYVQDDIALVQNRLRLTLGTKIENNNFTGWEVQPSAKLFFRPASNFAMWTSVSRAVRTPSRYERAARLSLIVDLPGSPTNPSPLPIYTNLIGVDRHSTRLQAYEAGLRADLSPKWSIDLAGYLNDYSRLPSPNLVSTTLLTVPNVPFPLGIIAEADLTGDAKARTWGGEVSIKGEVKPWWKLNLTWSHFIYKIAIDPQTGQPNVLTAKLDASPRNSLGLRNAFDLSDNVSFNFDLRHVGRLRDGAVPAYTTADLKLTAAIIPGLELSLVGENLLDDRHIEFFEAVYPAPVGLVTRRVSAEVRYRF